MRFVPVGGLGPANETVPQQPPFGSITDGEWVCRRCGESITGCMICIGEPVSLVRIKEIRP